MKIFKNVVAALFCLCLIPVVLAADSDLESHPGYVDFSTLTAIAATEPTAEFRMMGPLTLSLSLYGSP